MPDPDGLAAARALSVAAAEAVRGTTAPNPPVGAVVLDTAGAVVGVGATQPPGGPHAEVVALRAAGERARGGTVVVTLEPCAHHGRTPPCTDALLAAGVAAVSYAVADPNPVAAGGAAVLAAAGTAVTRWPDAAAVTRGPLRAWLHRARTGRAHLTWKIATSLDGRVAAADGTSRWITGAPARAEVHAERGRLDAVVVGTGTVLADDPWLTARTPDGGLAARQPVRVVVGRRPLPPGSRVLDDAAPTVLVPSHDPADLLAALAGLDDVLVEGGPTLVGALAAADLLDRVLHYGAPVLLGAGPTALGDAGVGTIGDALRFSLESVERVGEDVRTSLVRRPTQERE